MWKYKLGHIDMLALGPTRHRKGMPASAAAPTPRRDGRRLPLPPSPRGLPLLGQLRAHGRCCHYSSSAAATEEMMHARDLVFASRPTSAMVECLLCIRDVAFAPYG